MLAFVFPLHACAGCFSSCTDYIFQSTREGLKLFSVFGEPMEFCLLLFSALAFRITFSKLTVVFSILIWINYETEHLNDSKCLRFMFNY